ncbi:efflux transporter periplasmic adaptor subunit [Lysobacteraceae bacterium NML91-0213]|nr:efflux transporter periplasmic adaptor subunit [Xanthomonadaceae bacterium NML91-0213]
MLLAVVGCGSGPSPEPPRPVLVDTAPIQAGAGGLALAGEIRAREEAALSFRVAGQLVRRMVDAGDRVQAGQVLAELDPADLAHQARATRAQAAAAEAELARARSEHARYQALATDQLVSRSALEAQATALRAAEEQARAARAQAEVAGNQSAYARLRAPADGVIATREAEAGQVVAAGQTIYRFAADGAREVAVALPEARVGGFAVGQPVEVELWARPGVRLPGRIREISPAADPQSRSYAARVELDPAAGEVSLGQSARVHLQATGAGHRSVPLSAVQRGDDGTPRVWVVADGVARPVAVTLGAFGESRVPVLAGLPDDALVIAAGGHLLRDGQPVVAVDRNNAPIEPSSTTRSQEQTP